VVAYGQRIRQTIHSETGISMSGMGPIKTLANPADSGSMMNHAMNESQAGNCWYRAKIHAIWPRLVGNYVEAVFKPGYACQKAGVQLADFGSM